MQYHAQQTELGWEVADQTGTFETGGPVFKTKPEAEDETVKWNRSERIVSHAELLSDAFYDGQWD